MKLTHLPDKYRAQAIDQGATGDPNSPLDRLLVAGVKVSKHRNIPVRDANGKRLYDSRLEERVHRALVLEHGDANVIRQVSIPIGERRIRPDFLVILERFEDGSFRGKLIDAKGRATPEWLAKANHLKDKHGLEIETR